MSVGSLLDLNNGQEARRAELLDDKVVKRKLEAAPSDTSMTKISPKKKESRTEATKQNEAEASSLAAPEAVIPPAQLTPTTAPMEVDVVGNTTAKEAANTETSDTTIAPDKPTRRSVKSVKKKVNKDGTEVKRKRSEASPAKEMKLSEEKENLPTKEKEMKNDCVGKEIKREGSTKKPRSNLKLNIKREKSEPPTGSSTPTTEDPVVKPTERRKSKIFETAEKFMGSDSKSPTAEKPKKVFIPGVKVSDFAKAFERKSSIGPSNSSVKASSSRKSVPKEDSPARKEQTPVEEKKEVASSEEQGQPTSSSAGKPESPPSTANDEKINKARTVIASALVDEERKKIKKQILKPPVPRTKTDDSLNESKKKPMTLQIGKEKATVELHSPENTKFIFEPDLSKPEEAKDEQKEKKSAKVNITLKSNTLPRRTSKAEIQLTSPNYKTEVEHRVGDRGFHTQRSEVAFPVSAATKTPGTRYALTQFVHS